MQLLIDAANGSTRQELDGATTVLRTTAGARYRLIDSQRGNAALADHLIAFRKGAHLHLRYADGHELVLEQFFASDMQASVELPAGLQGAAMHLLSAATALSGATLTAPASAMVDAGTSVLYAHGQPELLQQMVLAQPDLASALGSQFASQSASAAAAPLQHDSLQLSWALLLLPALGLGLAAGGGGGSAASGTGSGTPAPQPGTPAAPLPPSEPPTPTLTIQGTVLAGPVVSGHGLSVAAYRADGSELVHGTVNPDGSYSMTVSTTYQGLVTVRVVDSSSGADYMDEGSHQASDLVGDLRAVFLVDHSGTYSVNINPLTELLTRSLGLLPGDHGQSQLVLGASAAQLAAMNAQLAHAFGLNSLTGDAVIPTIRADGSDNSSNANNYGVVLAALSALGHVLQQSTPDVLAQLRGAIDSNGQLNSATKLSLLLAGAETAVASPAALGAALGITNAVELVQAEAAVLKGAAGQSAPTLAQLQLLGISGVSAANLAAVQAAIAATADNGSAVNTLSELQAVVSAAILAAAASSSALSTLTNYDGKGSAPGVSVYDSAGVSGVSAANLNSINEALALLPASATASAAAVQSMVDAYNAILNGSTTPTPAQYQAIGVSGIDSAAQAGLLAAVLRTHPAAVGSVQAIQTLASAVDALFAAAASADSSHPGSEMSLAQLQALGVSGVTPDNLAAVQIAIAGSADNASGVATLPALQTLASAAEQLVARISNYDGSSTPLTSNDFANAGYGGVSDSTLAAITALLAQQHGSGTPVQSLIDAYNVVTDGHSTPGTAQYQALGISGIDSAAELALMADELHSHPGVTAPADLQALASAVQALLAAAASTDSSHAGSEVTLQQLQLLGLSGVTASNLAAVQAAIAASADDGSALANLGAVQTLVGNAVAGSLTPPPPPPPPSIPAIASVALTGDTGGQNHRLNGGDVLTASVTFSEAVTVSGSPQLALDIGGTTVQAVYAGGSGSSTLSFNYTIQAGQSDSDGIAIASNSLSLNSGSIQSSAGSAATLSHASVAANANYLVDNSAPAVSTLALSAASGVLNSTLNAGDVVTASVTFDAAVIVSGTPQLTLDVGGSSVQASYQAGSGSNTLTFSYTILPGQNDASGIAIGSNAVHLNGGTITDLAGNNALLGHAAVSDNASYLVDTATPLATLLSSGTFLNSATINVQSSEPGTAYLIQTSGPGAVSVSGLASLSGAADASVNSASISSANSSTSLALTGLSDGIYSLYVSDAAGNLSALAAGTIVIGDAAAALAGLSNYNGSGTAPSALDYAIAGVSGVTAANLAAINDILATLPGSATDSLAELQNLVDAAATVLSGAAGGAGPTLAQLTLLGMSGVTSDNLAALQAAIAATADDGSAVDTLAELQAVLSAAAAAAATALSSLASYNGGGSAPTAQDYGNAGISGVNAGNLAAINDVLASLPGTAHDTAAEIQALVNAENAVLTGAAGGTPPTLAELTLLGISGVSSDNLTAVQAAIAASPDSGSAVDTLSELQTLVSSAVAAYSAAIAILSNYDGTNTVPVLQDYRDVAVTGVNAGNLAAINDVVAHLLAAATDSTAEIQALVTAEAAVLSGAAGGTAPTLVQLQLLGMNDVTLDNLSALQLAIATSADDGSGVDTQSELQTLLSAAASACTVAQNTLSNYNGGGTPPAVQDYTDAGVTGVNAGNLAAINEMLSHQTATARDSSAELQALVDAENAVLNGAAGGTGPTLAQLQLLGMSGVTASNLGAIQAAIAGTADDGSGVDTLAELQSIVTAGANAASASALAILSNYDGSNTVPTLADYSNAGVTGMGAGNLAALNSVLAALSPAATDTASELQALVDAEAAVISAAAGGSAPTLAQLQLLGLSGITTNNLAAVQAAIAATADDGSAVDTLAELQSVVNSGVNAALAAALAILSNYNGSNTVPTEADYAMANVTGVSAGNLAAVNDVLANLAVAATDSTAELQTLVSAVNAVLSNAAGGAGVNLAQLQALGINGVSSYTLAAVQVAIAASADDGSAVDTLAELQSVVTASVNTALTAALATLKNYDGSNTVPTEQDYGVAGVSGVTAGNLAAMNDVLASLPQLATDSTAELQALVDAEIAVLGGAAGGSAPSLAQLQLLGITGVTSGNLAAIQSAIAATPDNGSAVDTLSELQSVVSAAASTASAAALLVLASYNGSNSVPTLQDYGNAGATGVSAGNLAIVNGVLAALPGSAHDTLAEIQTLISAESAVLSGAAGGTVPTLAQLQALGISGVTAGNLLAVQIAIAASADDGSAVDTLAELQTLATAAALAASNDHTPPAAPLLALGSGVSDGASSTEARAAGGVVTVSAELGSSIQVLFNRGATTIVKNLTGSGAPQPVVLDASDLLALGDGTISVSSMATDAAGNISTAATTAFTLDATAPAAAILALGSGVADGATSAEATSAGGVITVNAEAGATVQLSFSNGASTVSKTVTGSGTAQPVLLSAGELSTLGDGSITVNASISDAAGNAGTTSSTTFALDTSAPSAPTLTLNPGVADGATALEATDVAGVVTVSGEAGVNLQVVFSNGIYVVSKTVVGAGAATPVAVVLTVADLGILGAGTVNVSASSVDAAGNHSSTSTASFNLTASTARITTIAGDDVINSSEVAAGVIVAGSSVNASYVTLSWNGNSRTVMVDATGAWSAVFTGSQLPATDGSSTITVLPYSIAGIAGVIGIHDVVLNTATASTPTINAIATDNLVNSTEKNAGVTVSGTASNGANLVVTWGAVSKTVSATGAGWSVTFSSAELPADGSYNVTATATENGGNPASASHAVTVQTALQGLPTMLALVTHNATSSNLVAGTATSTYSGTASDSSGNQYVFFSAPDATQFGNGGSAYTDSVTANADLFAYNLTTGVNSLISHWKTTTSAGAGTASYAGASSDGRYVIFTANNASAYGNGGSQFTDANTTSLDVFAYNLGTGLTSLVTHTAAIGNTAAGTYFVPPAFKGISADGQYVLFEGSDATQYGNAGTAFTDGNTNAPDQFAYKLSDGSIHLITHSAVAAGTTTAGVTSTYLGTSGDGKSVFFSANNATNFGNGGTAFGDILNGSTTIFVYDLASGNLSLASHTATAGNQTATGSGTYKGSSNDGQTLVFATSDVSFFGNNGAAYTDTSSSGVDLISYNISTGIQTLVTHTSAIGNSTAGGTASATWITFSADSQYLIFNATNATQYGNNGVTFFDGSSTSQDLYAYNLNTGYTSLISHTAVAGNNASSTNPVSYAGQSSDGQTIFFSSANASQFGNNGTAFSDLAPSVADLFAYNLDSGVTSLVTHNASVGNQSAGGGGDATFAGSSANGKLVFFTASDASRFGNNGTAFTDGAASGDDLFVQNLATGLTTLISHNASAGNLASGNTSVTWQGSSADGKTVFFSAADASQFGNNGVAFSDSATATQDLFSYALDTGVIRLLSSGASASSSLGQAVTFKGSSSDGNLVYYATSNVGALSNVSGTALTDNGSSATDLVAVRLNLLDLSSAGDSGISAYDNITSQTSYTINGYVLPSQSVALYDNGVQIATASASAAGLATFNLSGVSAGSHQYTLFDGSTGLQLSLYAADPNGGASTLGVTVAPTTTASATLNAVAGDNTINATEKAAGVLLSGTASNTSYVSVTWNGTTRTAQVSAQGNWSLLFAGTQLPAADGASVLTVIPYSVAGVAGGSVARTVTVNTAALASPTIATVAGNDIVDSTEKTAGVTITGTATSGDTVALTWGSISKSVSAASGSWSISFSAAEIPADGSYTLQLRETSAEGNTATASRTVSVAATATMHPYLLLMTHDATAGNTTSGNAIATYHSNSSDSQYLLFTAKDASQFGNAGSAFSDATPLSTDLFTYNLSTGITTLISHTAASNSAASASTSTVAAGFSANSQYAFFTAANAGNFGNGGSAFTDTATSNTDIFAYQLASGTTSLVTHSAVAGNQTAASGATSAAFITATADSRYVIFSNNDVSQYGNSGTAFTDAGTGNNDLLAYDLASGVTSLITHSATATAAGSVTSTYLAASTDGGYVYFYANNATQFGNGGSAFSDASTTGRDLFAYNLASGVISLASHTASSNTSAGNASLGDTTFVGHSSADGKYLFFSGLDASQFGNAGQAFSDARQSFTHLFAYNADSGQLSLMTHTAYSSTAALGINYSTFNAVSADGKYVIYSNPNAASFGNNGVGFTDKSIGISDLLAYNLQTGATSLITHSATAGNMASTTGNGATYNAMSADGRYVLYSVFGTFGNNAISAFGDNGVAFNSINNGLSGTPHDLLVYDLDTGLTSLVTHNADASRLISDSVGGNSVQFSPDAKYVLFSGPGFQFGNNGSLFSLGTSTSSLMAYKLSTGEISLVNHSATTGNQQGGGDAVGSQYFFSADGQNVFFHSNNAALSGNTGTSFTDSNSAGQDLMSYSLATGILRLISSDNTGLASNGKANTFKGTSADGNLVFYAVDDVSTMSNSSGTALTDGNTSGTDLIAVRLNLLDLRTIDDTGSSATDNITSLTSYTLNGYVQAGQAVQLYDNGVQVASATADSQGVASFALSGVSAGVHHYTLYDSGSGAQISLFAKDASGGATMLTVTVTPTSAASASIATVAGDDVINSTEKAAGVVVSGSAIGASYVSVSWNGSSRTSAVNSLGQWSLLYAGSQLPASDGSSTITVLPYDLSGAAGSSSSRTVNVSTASVATPTVNAIAGNDSVSLAEKSAGVSLTGSATTGDTVQVSWGTLSKSVSASAGAWSVNFAASEIPVDGSYTVQVRASNADGNFASSSRAVSVATSMVLPPYMLLASHNASAGNLASGSVAITYAGAGSDSQYLFFTAANATQFGNNGSAYTDANTSFNDLYAYNLLSGVTSLVSHTAAVGNSAAGSVAATYAGSSGNGQYLLFSAADATQFGNAGSAFSNSGAATAQLYAYRLSTGVTSLVSHTATASNGEAGTSAVALAGSSANGQYVFFSAANAAQFGNSGTAFTDAGSGATDLFAYNLASGLTSLVTHSATAGNGAAGSTTATWRGSSADSQFVFFSAVDATQFGNGGTAYTDGNTALADLFAYNLASGVTSLISHTAASGNSAASNGASTFNAGSSDGQYVIFTAANATQFGNSNLAFTDASTVSANLFAYNLSSGVTRLVTHNETAGNTAAGSSVATFKEVSSDGQYVFFADTNATQYGNNGTSFSDRATAQTDLFAYRLSTGTISLVSHNASAGNATSGTAAATYAGSTSDSGYVIFTSSDATQYGAAGTPFTDADTGISDLFAFNISSGVTSLVSHNGLAGNTASGVSASTFKATSLDGKYVLFTSDNATQFGNGGTVFQDGNAATSDLFAYNLASGTTSLVSHNATGGNLVSGYTAVTYVDQSADGQLVFFTANDASQFGNNSVAFSDSSITGTPDLFSYSLATGVTRLITSTANGLTSSGMAATYAGTSADGNLVYFTENDVHLYGNASASSFSDGGTSAADLVAVRLNILDLLTPYDTGTSALDNITSLHSFTLNGYVKAGEAVALKDNGVQVATATADAQGVAAFALTGMDTGIHNYTLFDTVSGLQLTLNAADYQSGAAKLQVIIG